MWSAPRHLADFADLPPRCGTSLWDVPVKSWCLHTAGLAVGREARRRDGPFSPPKPEPLCSSPGLLITSECAGLQDRLENLNLPLGDDHGETSPS